MSNSGIHVSIGACQARVAAGDVKRVPCPGPNHARNQFWGQNGAVQGTLLGDDPYPAVVNLLLLWRTRPDDSISLTLAIPSGSWSFWGKPKLIGAVSLDDDWDGEFDPGDDEGHDLVEDLVADIYEHEPGS